MGPGELPDRLDFLTLEKESNFPSLRSEGYRVTSEHNEGYKCIAHAADRKDARWWPISGEVEGVYWPRGVSPDETVEAFVQAYGQLGYAPCESPTLEPGFEKIALYVDADGVPSHAARQLSAGRWTSKLGEWEDIEHATLAALEGNDPAYGTAVAYLRRPDPRLAEPIQAVAKVPPPRRHKKK